MRPFYLAPLLACFLRAALPARAQEAPTAQSLIKQGVQLYDAGKLAEAVAAYQQALKLEPGNSTAQYELAMTYNSLGRNTEAVELCKRLLKQDPQPTANVYGTYGNALDGAGKPKEALKAYQEGLKRFPDEGSLYYNQGITQAVSLKQIPEAVASMQQSVRCRPQHLNSINSLALLTAETGNRIPALLETMYLLQLEPTGKRAEAGLARVDKMMGQGVKQTGEKSVTINLSSDVVSNAGRKGGQPDNFAGADMLLTMTSALDFDDKNKNKTASERFVEKFTTLCSVLEERDPAKQEGFVWQFYAPYFVELNKQGHVPALVYLAQSSRAEATPEVKSWLAAHPQEIQALRTWSAAYIWPK